MPLLAVAGDRVHEDCENDHEQRRLQKDAPPGQHEIADPKKHGEGAKHEIEDVPATEGLGEMAGEAVRPFVPGSQEIERHRDRLGAVAGLAIQRPFL